MQINFLIFGSIAILLLSSAFCKDQSSPKIKEGFIQVPGGKVWYRIVGVGKKGIPLLVLHGGPGAPHYYLKTIEALADERPVIFYDQLGCGNSDKSLDTTLWTVARFVEELEQVRQSLELGTIHILGQSWGTMLAVEYLLRKESKGVLSLILSAPYLTTARWIADQQYWIAQLPPNIQDTIRKYEASGDYSSQSYQDAMMYFYRKHLCRLDPWPEYLTKTLEQMGTEVYNYMFGPSEFTMTGTLKDADLSEQLSRIKIPVLFTCGEFDEAKPATTAWYQSKLPGSEMYVFRDASHSHHLEKVEEYNQVVRDFLKKAEKK
jgi:proline iminopeptidase